MRQSKDRRIKNACPGLSPNKHRYLIYKQVIRAKHFYQKQKYLSADQYYNIQFVWLFYYSTPNFKLQDKFLQLKKVHQPKSMHRKMQTPIVVTQNFTKREFPYSFKQVGVYIFCNSMLERMYSNKNPCKITENPLY